MSEFTGLFDPSIFDTAIFDTVDVTATAPFLTPLSRRLHKRKPYAVKNREALLKLVDYLRWKLSDETWIEKKH